MNNIHVRADFKPACRARKYRVRRKKKKKRTRLIQSQPFEIHFNNIRHVCSRTNNRPCTDTILYQPIGNMYCSTNREIKQTNRRRYIYSVQRRHRNNIIKSSVVFLFFSLLSIETSEHFFFFFPKGLYGEYARARGRI